jgi:hypothetical protein
MDDYLLSEFIKKVYYSIEELNSKIIERTSVQNKIGIVLRVLDSSSPNYKLFPKGATEIIVHDNDYTGNSIITAMPMRTGHGNFELPNPGSVVVVKSLGNPDTKLYNHYYDMSAPIEYNPIHDDGGYYNFFNTEAVGFTFRNQTFDGYIGGRYVKKVFSNPGKAKIINSTNTFVFFQDEANKQIELKGADDYQMKLHVGDKGQIRMGYLDDLTDATQTGSADYDLDLGIKGNATIQTIEGNVNVRVTTSTGSNKGYIKLQAGSCSITISQDGIYIAGNTYISGETMVSQDIHWNTVGFSQTTPPLYSTATRNIGRTHMHPTAVPGPPSPPTPGT